MNIKLFFKILGFGLLLFVILMVSLFVMSIITSSEQPNAYWWVGAIVAAPMTACSFWFSRLLHAASFKQALSFGGIWALELLAILLIIAIPNQTAGIVFGQWSTYLIFLGVALGPLLWTRK